MSWPEAAAGRGLIALSMWSGTQSGVTVAQVATNTYDPDILVDFMADVRHLLHNHGADFDAVVEASHLHFAEEIEGKRLPLPVSVTALAAERYLEQMDDSQL